MYTYMEHTILNISIEIQNSMLGEHHSKWYIDQLWLVNSVKFKGKKRIFPKDK